MPEIDLKPSEYREKGRRRIRRVSTTALGWLMTVCGIWAGIAFSLYRNFFPTEPGWWSWPIAGTPALLLWIYVIVTVKE